MWIRLGLLLLLLAGVGIALALNGPSTAAFMLTPTPSASEIPIPQEPEPVAANADWTPVEQDFDGTTMVLVPPGCFIMGSTDEQIDYAVSLGRERERLEEEQPAHEQCFDEPFWIDKTEVTNAQYGSIGCEDYSSSPDQPHNCVTWFDAKDFCEQRGARLPTEREWEYAARGPDGLVYPWGNTFVADNVVYSGNSGGQSVAVGSRPGGASWVGALDMTGNVWEWTSSLYADYPYDPDDGREDDAGDRPDGRRALRGGGFGYLGNLLRAAFRFWPYPDGLYYFGGFRCVRDYDG